VTTLELEDEVIAAEVKADVVLKPLEVEVVLLAVALANPPVGTVVKYYIG
jgi:hypothetical protein